MENKVKVCLEL